MKTGIPILTTGSSAEVWWSPSFLYCWGFPASAVYMPSRRSMVGRPIAELRMDEMTESPFLNKQLWVSENESAFALPDSYPVTKGHTLIVPKRTVLSIFELTEREILDCWRLLAAEKKRLETALQPDGFNVGVNVGSCAGQTVPHAHIHLIPRYYGDNPNPRGGIRAVIPHRADY